MKVHYELKPLAANASMLVFDWNVDTGEISGPDATKIMRFASDGVTQVHPEPSVWTLSDAPLKSKADMAAILGYAHELPADLASFYPKLPSNGAPDTSYTDADGVFVVGNDLILH